MASSSKKLRANDKNSEFPTNWDLDYYHTEHESEEHWALRKRFMQVHKNKFPEDRLVCLAQVFTNMEFMGCKYPSETMILVAELSKDIAKEFRAQRSTKLKRTFVAASDAAESRAKGRRTATTMQQQQTQQQQGNNWQNSRKRKHFGMDEEQQSQRFGGTSNKRAANVDLFAGLPFGKLVLFLFGGRNCLRTSAQRCNMEYLEREVNMAEGIKKVELHVGGKCVASACEENLKASKAKLFSNALEELQRCCYSIKPNPLRDTIKIDKSSNNQVVCGVTKQQADTLEDKKLDATNKGYKMMKMMGWSGGGLGSNTQGREEPVGYLLKNNRAGLGNAACKLDRTYFSQMLRNYIESDDIRELQFESTFTKDERAMLHEIAGKFNLKSTSHGKDESRRLVISKKTISNEQILSEILLHKNDKYCDKYFVQVPTAKANLYPEHTATLELD